MSDRHKTAEGQYEDCDTCGERYWGDTRRRYLSITLTDDGLDLQAVCCEPKKGK